MLALGRQIVVHDPLNDVHLLGLLLRNFLTDCVELLYGRFEVDQLLVNVLFMFVWDLCTLLLKFLLVLSEKSTGNRSWSVLVSTDKASVQAGHYTRVIQLSASQLGRSEFRLEGVDSLRPVLGREEGGRQLRTTLALLTAVD